MKNFAIASAVGFVFFGALAPARPQTSSTEQITSIAESSECAAFKWGYAADLPKTPPKDARRGVAPAAFMRGVALVFARAICHPDRADVKVVSAARGAQGSAAVNSDAVTWYDSMFQAGGMSNAVASDDTLRHTYALLIALGMQESSGKYCTGRDRSQNFKSADSAEAGLLQTSWGASKTKDVLPPMFQHYKSDQTGCLLDVFRSNVTCDSRDAKNWGTGKGAEWQQLTKMCPAFSIEYGAVVMRSHGGQTGEFGPIRRKWAEVLPACDAMLSKIQNLVQANPGLCGSLP